MAISYYLKKFIDMQRKNLNTIRLLGKLKAKKRVFFGKKVDVSIRNSGEITIKEHSSIGAYSGLASVGGKICIGERTFINCYADIVCHEMICIGNHCAIGPRVTIYDHDHRFGKDGVEKGFKKTKIVIGDNCWIGANVTILRGTIIGKNCVIGAGCVVKGEIPDNTLVTQSRELILKPIL